MEPGGVASDAPPRLVDRQAFGRPGRVDHFGVGRGQAVGRPKVDLDARAPREVDAEERREHRRHFAVRQAQSLVELDRRRLGIRADLAGRRPQRVGGLQGMAALHPLAALPAVADVNVEATHDRPPRD